MPSTPLLLDLTGVARLADVRRPAASMWRSRFAQGADPFPSAVTSRAGRPLFDALSIAEWLDRTGRGNNPDVIADVAASATPPGFDYSDRNHISAIDGLLVLHAAFGASLGEVTDDQLVELADSIDPEDTCLRTEALGADRMWREWASQLADAAYSPAQASRILEKRNEGTRSASGASGPLVRDAEELLLTLVRELAVGRSGYLVLQGGLAPSLAAELMAVVGDDVEPVVDCSGDGRSIRRRRLLDELELPAIAPAAGGSRLLVARFPSGAAETIPTVLDAIGELVVEMSEDDRAVVLAPAAALIDPVTGGESRARTDILRSGRVRAIVNLPTGLVTAAPRSSLAFWVLGRQVGDIPIADRVTAIADLTDAPLSRASRADLTSDVMAALGSMRDLRAHSFRFARLVKTSTLLASRGALRAGKPSSDSSSTPIRDLPALLEQAHAALGEELPRTAPATDLAPEVESATIESLRKARHLRLIGGTRLAAQEFVESGLVVVGAAELDDPSRVGTRHVDRLTFAAQHPTAELTRPGDVVFRTGPTPWGWVDPDGSKVVAHPARVLRIDPADPGGLVPELIAADIERSPGGPGSWRRWALRRVAPRAVPELRAALAEIASQRDALARRMSALDDYAELLTAGVASGVVTLNDAVDAASDPQ
jgi:hypothetical protein